MGYREGIGDELTDGSFRFAGKYGHPEISMSSKNSSLPVTIPVVCREWGFPTQPESAEEIISTGMISAEVLGIPEKLDPFVNEGKAVWTKAFQDLTAAIDAAGICLFTSLAPMGAPDYAAMVSAVTGMAIDGNDLMRIGERIWTVQKLFNVRVGYTKSDDTLPDRLLTEPLKEGEPAGRVWNANRFSMNTTRYGVGIPRVSRHREKLKELGLT